MSFCNRRALSAISVCFSIASYSWNNSQQVTESRVPASVISAVWGKSDATVRHHRCTEAFGRGCHSWQTRLLQLLCLPVCRCQQSLHCNGFRTLQRDLYSAECLLELWSISSPYRWGQKPRLSIRTTRSAVYIINSIRPWTELCGTPQTSCTEDDPTPNVLWTPMEV